jgi:hypothetical protein
MVEEKKTECCDPKKWHRSRSTNENWGAVYFLGIIGVAVYYVQQVSGFWPVVLAILKAIVWPAFLLHKVFSMLNM